MKPYKSYIFVAVIFIELFVFNFACAIRVDFLNSGSLSVQPPPLSVSPMAGVKINALVNQNQPATSNSSPDYLPPANPGTSGGDNLSAIFFIVAIAGAGLLFYAIIKFTKRSNK